VGFLVSRRVGTSCAVDARDDAGSLGAASQREAQSGWKIIQGTDFNRDGLGDVLWNEPATNRITVWLLNVAQILARGPVLAGPGADGR